VKAHLLRETGKGTAICNAATPEMVVQFCAEKVVAKSLAQDSCERNWSTYGFIHSLRRNKLTHECECNTLFFVKE
jgi:hypothetical protein